MWTFQYRVLFVTNDYCMLGCSLAFSLLPWQRKGTVYIHSSVQNVKLFCVCTWNTQGENTPQLPEERKSCGSLDFGSEKISFGSLYLIWNFFSSEVCLSNRAMSSSCGMSLGNWPGGRGRDTPGKHGYASSGRGPALNTYETSSRIGYFSFKKSNQQLMVSPFANGVIHVARAVATNKDGGTSKC